MASTVMCGSPDGTSNSRKDNERTGPRNRHVVYYITFEGVSSILRISHQAQAPQAGTTLLKNIFPPRVMR